MEVIKKKIKMAMTTGTTTGCTSNDNCFVIVPDTGATYNFKILLTSKIKDLGFFDVDKKFYYTYYYGDDNMSGIGENLMI